MNAMLIVMVLMKCDGDSYGIDEYDIDSYDIV